MEIIIKGIIGEDVLTTDIADKLLTLKEGEDINLFIDSYGGYVDESFKIIELLESFRVKGHKIISQNIGNVMSAAVGIFLTGDERYFDLSKGDFFVHNPWMDASGDAEDLKEYADRLENIENKILDYYSERTGVDKEIWRVYLDKDMVLNADEILKLNCAKIINSENISVKNKNKAVAMLNIKNREKMEKNLSKIEKLIKAIANKLRVKQIVLIDTQGNELDFGESVTDESQIVVGVTATVNGEPANGQYTLEQLGGGSVLTFENGVLVDIQPLVDSNSQTITTEASEQLENEVQEVINGILAIKKAVKKQEAEILELKKEMARIKAKFNAVNFVQTPESIEPQKIKKSFNI